ncbi:hypothetical protein QE152_g37909 [Popillia japonica]|uniref:Uncharacterized protein n=1 Tax=Popillia japonica TaxID=7064 RepID=A0AAW1I8V3_POPJA
MDKEKDMREKKDHKKREDGTNKKLTMSYDVNPEAEGSCQMGDLIWLYLQKAIMSYDVNPEAEGSCQMGDLIWLYLQKAI